MKAQELRIGNIFNYKVKEEGKEYDEISTIDNNDLRILLEKPDYENYNPVPLTDEWFLKARFVKLNSLNDTVYYKKNAIRLKKGIDCYEFGSTKIKYLHQLQNLYFALTGEELKFFYKKK